MKTNKHKILIIKVGYSETLDKEISGTSSYGDVMRTTVLLHIFRDSHVSWLVDRKSYAILKNIEEIDRILVPDPLTLIQLQAEHFDTVINLEKVPGLCALADSIKAWRRYGFRFDEKNGKAEAYDGTQSALYLCNNIDSKRKHNKCAQEILFEMVGEKWNGESYVFGHKFSGDVKFDIGFNHAIGSKWPNKAWPEEYWKKLEGLLRNEFTISWQQGMENMEDYFEWIHSCKLIVTNDSFGLHLAISMQKRVVSLFGPTNPNEVYLYGLGESLSPESDCPYLPCHEQNCVYKKECMYDIAPDVVYETIKKILV